MLLSSFFVPHSPVLVPRIGKEHTEQLKKTALAFDFIKERIETLKPETIIILSAHSPLTAQSFNINFHEEYKIDLAEFGDLTTRETWRPDIEVINHIAYEGAKCFEINLMSQNALDYGSAIPLLLLTSELAPLKIVPITFAEQPLPEMHRFGIFLEKEISALNKRCIILATGDLSHRLTKKSPSGYSQKAVQFDARIQQAIQTGVFEPLLNVEPALLSEVGQCGMRALLVLAGAMHNKNVKPSLLSYENPLGVGYLAAYFELQ